MNRFSLLVFTILLSPSARSHSYRFDPLTEREGPGSATFEHIAGDAFGFIWIGPWDGVSRFDGIHIRNFRENPNDSLAIRSQDGRMLAADHKGGVWVAASSRSLEYYDSVVDGFRHYEAEQGVVLRPGERFAEPHVTVDGQVFATTETGVLRLDPETDRFGSQPGSRARDSPRSPGPNP